MWEGRGGEEGCCGLEDKTEGWVDPVFFVHSVSRSFMHGFGCLSLVERKPPRLLGNASNKLLDTYSSFCRKKHASLRETIQTSGARL